jgi:DNA adenine methylase
MNASLSQQSLRPVLKWAGGKRKLLPAIRPLIPPNFKRYVEPFLGGGAVLFDLAPNAALVNDFNQELIDMYSVIRDSVNELIDTLSSMEVSAEKYYEIRAWDRSENFREVRSPIERAARTIYLNRCGYNGLYRVNAANQSNVPYGRYKNPQICDRELLINVSNYLSKNKVKLLNEDFRKTLSRVKSGDFIYVDPPYAPLDDALSTFTSYTSKGFSLKDLMDLKVCLDEATDRGATWVLSNVRSEATSDMFPTKRYRVQELQVSRPINSKSSGRGTVTEILVTSK